MAGSASTSNREPTGRITPRLVAVVVVALALYGRTLTFDFSYLDDSTLILDEQQTASHPTSVWRSFARPYFQSAERDHDYYRPLVNASYALDGLWSGSSPRGYHLTNVVLHALAAGLFFQLLRRSSYGPNVALWGGLVFAVHPALTEAVAWIPGRNDSLLAVFVLASWLFFLRSWQGAGRSAWLERMAHLMAWLAALFTKETAVVLPLVCVGHLALLEHRRWRDLVAPSWLVGWVATFAVYLAARATVASNGLGMAGVSARNLVSNLPGLVSGLGKLVLPVHLAVLAIPEDTRLWPGVVAGGLILATLLVTSLPASRLRRQYLWFGAAVFAAFSLPGLPASNRLLLENRLYLPAVGILIVACEIATALGGGLAGKTSAARSWLTRGRGAASGAIVGALAVAAFSYSDSFRGRLAFSEAAVRGSPHSALAHRNLGVTYQVAGDADRARSEYEAALLADPAEPVVHNNLAVLHMAKGELPDAERHLREELAINPRYAQAHHNLALVLGALGRVDEAAVHRQRSLELNGAAVDALRAPQD